MVLPGIVADALRHLPGSIVALLLIPGQLRLERLELYSSSQDNKLPDRELVFLAMFATVLRRLNYRMFRDKLSINLGNCAGQCNRK